jgi:O-antigen/teichoic acid export membrane protein
MNEAPRDPVRQLLGGGTFLLLADALQLPSVLVLGMYLSRRLGAEGLGLYLLASSLIGWLELAVSTLFARATVHLVAESRDWKPIASLALRWHAGVCLIVLAALWLVVAPFPQILGAPGLASCVLLFSLEIPLFAVTRSHAHVMLGLGRYQARAWTSVARWSTRCLLGMLLVELGLGVKGAILGALGSTLVELVVARWYVRPPLLAPTPPGLRRKLFDYSWPLFLHGVSIQLFHRLGLLLLVPLGGTVAAAGVYGAADSLLRIRRTLGQSLTPLLLSTLSRMTRDDQAEAASRLSRNALRVVLLTVPAMAAIAGAAAPIMAWIFGPAFVDGGPVLGVLIAGAPPFVVISVATAIFTARSRPRAPVVLTAPMVPAALLGYWLAIPRWGGLGAAWVTALALVATGLACLLALRRLAGIAPPAATALRTAAVSIATFFAARALPVGGWWLPLELPLLVLAGAAALLALGELDAKERSWLRREVGSIPARLRLRANRA